MPSTVDSAAVAGILDLLRCQGVWYHSVRYGFLFGPTRSTLDYDMPTKAEFEAAASIAQSKFASLLFPPNATSIPSLPSTLRPRIESGSFEEIARNFIINNDNMYESFHNSEHGSGEYHRNAPHPHLRDRRGPCHTAPPVPRTP